MQKYNFYFVEQNFLYLTFHCKYIIFFNYLSKYSKKIMRFFIKRN